MLAGSLSAHLKMAEAKSNTTKSNSKKEKVAPSKKNDLNALAHKSAPVPIDASGDVSNNIPDASQQHSQQAPHSQQTTQNQLTQGESPAHSQCNALQGPHAHAEVAVTGSTTVSYAEVIRSKRSRPHQPTPLGCAHQAEGMSKKESWLANARDAQLNMVKQEDLAWEFVPCWDSLTNRCGRTTCRLPHPPADQVLQKKMAVVCLAHVAGSCNHNHWTCNRVHLKPQLIRVTRDVILRGGCLPRIPSNTQADVWAKMMEDALAPLPATVPEKDDGFGPRPCGDFLRGICKRPRCNFPHLAGEELTAAQTRIQSRQGVKLPFICPQFIAGTITESCKCTASAAGCKFLHPTDPTILEKCRELYNNNIPLPKVSSTRPRQRTAPNTIQCTAGALRKALVEEKKTPLAVAVGTITPDIVPQGNELKDLLALAPMLQANVPIGRNPLFILSPIGKATVPDQQQYELLVRTKSSGFYALKHDGPEFRRHVGGSLKSPYYVATFDHLQPHVTAPDQAEEVVDNDPPPPGTGAPAQH